MPLNFKSLPMMALRSAPGEVLDQVAQKGESFVIERNGQQLACLVPLSLFMPDIQPSRVAFEFEQLREQDIRYRTTITDNKELQLQFLGQGREQNLTVTMVLPHGYPNSSPKVTATPLPVNCPHRWEDGSLCIFGAMELWNPGEHNVLAALRLARRWVAHFETWQWTGNWGEGEIDDGKSVR